jgi:hypothetical protein
MHTGWWFRAAIQIKSFKNNPASSDAFSGAGWRFFTFFDKRVPRTAIIAFSGPFWRNSPALLANE